MLPPRASILALVLLAAALATTAAQEAMPAAAAAPAPEGMAAAAPAPEAENPLVSQYRLSPEQVAVLESLGLTDPQSIMADLQAAGVTPSSELPTKKGDPTLYDYVLFAFVKTGDADAVRLMLSSEDAKANANIRDAATGETPIFSAVEQSQQNPELLAALIAGGADTNTKRRDGATPLLLAIAGGYNETVGALLGPQQTPLADPNLPSSDGLTPLNAAIVSDQPAIVQQLLNAGAGANTPGAGGELPLVEAVLAMPANPEIVQALLAAGADPSLPDATGTTARQAAQQSGNPEIIQLLGGSAPAPGAEMAAPTAGARVPAAEMAAAPTGP